MGFDRLGIKELFSKRLFGSESIAKNSAMKFVILMTLRANAGIEIVQTLFVYLFFNQMFCL